MPINCELSSGGRPPKLASPGGSLCWLEMGDGAPRNWGCMGIFRAPGCAKPEGIGLYIGSRPR
jgi:hypothetical protein